MQKLVRKFYYRVIFKERNMTTNRELAGQNFAEVIDLALKIYIMNWGVPPDTISIRRTGAYSWT